MSDLGTFRTTIALESVDARTKRLVYGGPIMSACC
jgi:hypothetical protein